MKKITIVVIALLFANTYSAQVKSQKNVKKPIKKVQKSVSKFTYGIYEVTPTLSSYESMYVMFNSQNVVITFLGRSPEDGSDMSRWKSSGSYTISGRNLKVSYTRPNVSTSTFTINDDGSLSAPGGNCFRICTSSLKQGMTARVFTCGPNYIMDFRK